MERDGIGRVQQVGKWYREERALQATGTQVSYQQMVETEMKHEVTIIEREWMERDSIETNRLVYDVGREERGY